MSPLHRTYEETLANDDQRRQAVHEGEDLLGEDRDEHLDFTLDDEVWNEKERPTNCVNIGSILTDILTVCWSSDGIRAAKIQPAK